MAWGWGEDLLKRTSSLAQGVIKVADDQLNQTARYIEGKGCEANAQLDQAAQQLADAARHFAKSDRPQELPVYSYQGQPGRHHNNETVITAANTNFDDNARVVQLACRVVGGAFAGGALARLNQTLQETQGVPNPYYHWCVTVGDYLHQLQATNLSDGWNYYTNEYMDRRNGGWDFYTIGYTKLNDAAIKDCSTKIMNEMPEVYDAFNNNCQTFSLRLVDRILTSVRTTKFKTANQEYSIQKAPVMDIKDFKRVTVTRIDTGEVVDPAEISSEVQPGLIQEVPATKAEPLVLEQAPVHGEPVEVAAAEKTTAGEIEIPRAQMLREVAQIIVRNTPTLTKEDIMEAEGATIAPTAQVAAV